ncbi:hypothetical protein L1987_32778 [Smallanthus sonchifolius]|uniref:Uncharacterized protein n=1 Tax=Smallanthus sonchifolius TaxID=185202 RepID=A0ACB9HP89_9ASTR|nr:hypothetical protein L1987_32778 [Smallanthus sonchifolius]
MEEEFVEELDVDGLPKWVKPRRLSSFEPRVQPELYINKIRSSTQGRSKLFLCERKISLDDFRKFGVTECFTRLGWNVNMSFNNDGDDTIYMDVIEEWMSTLSQKIGNNPPVTTQLIGRANGKEVVMSFTTLKKLAKFDTGAANGIPYHYPSDVVLSVEKTNEEYWKARVWELFVVPPGIDVADWKLVKENLKVMPKFLSERGNKMRHNPYKMSLLVHASEWKYELRKKSQEIGENRVYRRAKIHQQELFRNQDFMYHEQIRHERDYERGHAYTVRLHPENWADPTRQPYSVTQQLPHYAKSTPFIWVSPYAQTEKGASSSGDPYSMTSLHQGLYESVYGNPYTPPQYDG